MREEPVFCLCRQPDDGSVMVQCNYCNEWFHVACVGITSSALDGLREYKCHLCEQKPTEENMGSVAKKRTKVELSETRGPTGGTKLSNPPRVPKEENIQTSRPSYSPTLDPVRKTVVEGFYNVLLPHWDPESVSYPDCMTLAATIEEALFEKLSQAKPEPLHGQPHLTRCGQKYRSKYRTIQFNLKDPKNDNLRRNVITGSVPAARLIEMSPAEMANEEVAALIKTVREQSITQLTIPDGSVETGFVKKTHKGEDYLPGSLMEEGYLGKLTRPPTPPAVPSVRGQPIVATSEARPIESMERSKVVSLKNSGRLDDAAPCWRGKIYLNEVGRVPAQAMFLSSASGKHNSRSLQRLLPHNLHISGRIMVPAAADYMRTIWAGSSSREVILFHLTETTPLDPLLTVAGAIEYLQGHQRWAVVAHDPSRGIRDFYIATVDEDDLRRTVYPSSEAEKLRSLGLPALLGILVVAKDGRGVAPQQESYDPHRPSRGTP